MSNPNDEQQENELGREPIGRLFTKYFFPTLLSLSASAALNVADGIFVGKGVGDYALAAINVAAPVFMICTGLALLLGTGASVVVAIHLSRKKFLSANVNATNCMLTTIALLLTVATLTTIFARNLCYIFGGSELLEAHVVEYLTFVSPGLLFFGINLSGMFLIRLDGSPRYAMWATVIPSVLNFVLDYLFVFPLQMGVGGSALATSIAELTGAIMVGVYFAFMSKDVKMLRPSFTSRALRTCARNLTSMAQTGLPTFIGETALSAMMIVGNYMFISHLGEDGVAAFSVACYLMPVIFMFGNAVAQSAMPIISFNHGKGDARRVRRAKQVSMWVALVSGLLISVAGVLCCDVTSRLFLAADGGAYRIATEGLPLYSLGFIFLTLNVVYISNLQSVEQTVRANVFMLLRGYIIIVPMFMALPTLLGPTGLWLALPASECVTLICIGMARTISRWRN